MSNGKKAGVRVLKKVAKFVPVATATGRKSKKGNSTRETKKNRSTGRFVEVKIRITAEEFARGRPYFHGAKRLPQFALDAYTERVNRAEANDKAARLRILEGNAELLLPAIKVLHEQGKLDFLTNTGGEE